MQTEERATARARAGRTREDDTIADNGTWNATKATDDPADRAADRWPAAPAAATGRAPAPRDGVTGRQDRQGRHPVLSGLWTGFTYGLLSLVLLLAALVIVVPQVVGGVPLTILTGSMEPNLPIGSLAVVRPVEPADVRIGDVVTYLPNPDDPTAVTHRVTGIDVHQDGTRTFTLQGDANTAPDDPVAEHQVRGTVWYAVPGLGYVNTAVNGEHRTVVVYVVAGAFLLWAATLWWRAWRARRHRTS
ncbi:signal peptidase I [Isoptericola sp. NEAU-Y5]|uniref:Signal peptidase I n=1 Tax=Isoptericola luteus TaxID=2879484 RepID=A0ABS7ZE84_9MICO|nr:signal peptidase I [Isoptericola sp. NEAU-Y5]MCA5892129.1 signal peptidase I [Isoptericola sp. NEAU-Y5]